MTSQDRREISWSDYVIAPRMYPETQRDTPNTIEGLMLFKSNSTVAEIVQSISTTQYHRQSD